MRPLTAHTLLLFVCGSACAGAYETRSEQPYDPRFGDETVMDIYLPERAEPGPAVLLVHGGGWSGGSKEHFTTFAQRLAGSGYVAATINYRLTPDGVFPNNFRDVVCALSFLRAQGEVDASRVAAMGYSAGGHLVSLLGAASAEGELAADCESGTTSPPAAVIAGAAPHDLRSFFWEAEGLIGKPLEDAPADYARASPVAHVHAGMPPYLLITGGADWIVPESQSIQMRNALRAAGNDVSYLRLFGTGHLFAQDGDGDLLFSVSLDVPEAQIAIADFLERTIGAP